MRVASAFFALVAAGCATPMTPTDSTDAPVSLAAAETAFAAHSVREDMRAAFLAHFADDGVFVRDGWTLGNAYLAGQPAPPIVLDWRPVYTEVARSGELGLSTGPWKIVSKTKADEPPAYGQFVSVWRRAAGGRWQVEVDLGIAHPESALWPARLEAHWVREGPPPRGTIMVAEERFRKGARERGLRDAYRQEGAQDLRFYRAGSAPLVGKAAALDSAAMKEGPYTWTIERSAMARSGDFGYARGSYSLESMPSKPLGYFLRVWRAEQGEWRIVLDVTNAARS